MSSSLLFLHFSNLAKKAYINDGGNSPKNSDMHEDLNIRGDMLAIRTLEDEAGFDL
jgi:hypothetical protein